MADTGHGPKGIVFKAAVIAHSPAFSVELPDSLIDEIISCLDPGDGRWGPALRKMLPLQAQAYLNVKAIVSAERPQRSRKAVERLASALSEALKAMDDIGIEQSLALAMLLEKSEGPNSSMSMIQIRLVIEGFRDVAAAWVKAYHPTDRRPRNRALELQVGALMFLFEQVTGNRATASLKRTGSHAPRLTSPEARAIHLLLNAVDSSATETAVANKIVGISRELKGKSLGRYAPALLVGAPVYPIT